jgi:hypothetical protein
VNRGVAIAIGAAIVLAAVIGLVLLLRADADAPVVRPADPAPHYDQKIADRDAGKTRIVPIRRVPADASAGDPPTIESNTRDHRAPEHTSDEPPPPPPPTRRDGRRVNVSVTSSLSQGIQPVLQECAAAAPPGAATDTARVEGEILIAIRDHQAQVTTANLRLNGFAEAAQPAIQQCLQQRVVGLTAPASDETDIDGYAITVSMRWP